MADTKVQLDNPQEVTLPAYAMDSTSESMLTQLKAIAKDNKSLNEAFTKLIQATNENAKSGKAVQESMVTTLRNAVTESNSAGTSRSEAMEAKFQKGFGIIGSFLDMVSYATIGISAAALAMSKGIYSVYSDFSDNIGELQKVGLGFNDVNGSVTNSISSFNKLGITTDQAVKMMTEFSRATAIVGRDRMPKVTKQFLDITNKGRDLGVNLEDASEALMTEVESRSRLMNVSSIEEGKLAASAREQISIQNAYASALGISTANLRSSTASILDDNFNVAATLAMFPDSYNGLNSFVTASVATMGKGSESLVSALVDSATNISAFNGSAASDLSALSGLTGIGDLMFEFHEAMQGGTMTAAEGLEFSKKTRDAIMRADTKNLKQVANSGMKGAASAAAILHAQANILASNKKAEDIAKQLNGTFTADEIKDGMIKFENAWASIFGNFDNFKTIMMVKFAPFLTKISNLFGNEKTLNALSKGFEQIIQAVSGLVDAIFGGNLSAPFTIESFASGIKLAADTITIWIETLTDWIKSLKKSTWIDDLGKWIKSFTDKAGNIDWSGLILNGIKNIMSEMITLLGKALWEVVTSKDGWLIVGGVIGALIAKSVGSAVLDGLGKKITGKLGGLLGGSATQTLPQPPEGMGTVGKAASFASAANILALGLGVLMFAKAMQMIDGLSHKMESAGVLAVGILALAAATKIIGASLIVAGASAWAAVPTIVALGFAVVALGGGMALASFAIDAVGTAIEKSGKAIATVLDGVSRLVDAWGDKSKTEMQSRVDAIKQLSNIPNANIDQTASAITRLALAMAKFGGASGEGEWHLIGDSFSEAVEDRVDALNKFADLDSVGITRSATAITRIASALGNFANIDAVGIRLVSGAIDVMSKSNDTATSVYARFGELSADAINKSSLAVFNMNAANRGQLTSPGPLSGGNYLSNMARSMAGGNEIKKVDTLASTNSDSKLQPNLPKGANKVEELLYKLVYNSTLTVKNLQAISKSSKDTSKRI